MKVVVVVVVVVVAATAAVGGGADRTCDIVVVFFWFGHVPGRGAYPTEPEAAERSGGRGGAQPCPWPSHNFV